MQFSTIVALLAVAVGINAAPSIEVSKRVPAIPLSIYEGGGCNDPSTYLPRSNRISSVSTSRFALNVH